MLERRKVHVTSEGKSWLCSDLNIRNNDTIVKNINVVPWLWFYTTKSHFTIALWPQSDILNGSPSAPGTGIPINYRARVRF